jgi:hypothetical protein
VFVLVSLLSSTKSLKYTIDENWKGRQTARS